MSLMKIFKSKKLFFFNIFIILYVLINLISGERGLLSYYEKKKLENNLIFKIAELENNFNEIENKNNLLSKNLNLDYLDILYREKLKLSKKNEILIKLK